MLRPAAHPEKRGFEALLRGSIDLARELGLIEDDCEAAIDATGLEIRHVREYFGGRRGSRCPCRRRWPKLTAGVLTRSHMTAGAAVGLGPSADAAELPEAMRQATSGPAVGRLLADAGYDGEANHLFCRRELGVRSTGIALNLRPNRRRRPKTRCRRPMRRRSPRRVYGQRWQAERAFSRDRRRLGSALRARLQPTQADECLLRVLTHDRLLLLRLLVETAAPPVLPRSLASNFSTEHV